MEWLALAVIAAIVLGVVKYRKGKNSGGSGGGMNGPFSERR